MPKYVVKIKSVYDGLETHSVSIVDSKNPEEAGLLALTSNCHSDDPVIEGETAEDMNGCVVHSISSVKKVEPEHVVALMTYL